MKSSFVLPPLLRLIATGLIPVHLLTAMPLPLMAVEQDGPVSRPILDAAHPRVTTPENVRIKKGTREKIKEKPELDLSVAPDDAELRSVRLFLEPLIPMSGQPVPDENTALARALKAFEKREDLENFSSLITFLAQFPSSRWKASLNLNLGLLSYERGYLSQALSFWQSAWNEAKGESGQEQQMVADRAIGELLLLNARVGRTSEIEKYLAELGDRNVQGSVALQVDEARQGLQRMKNNPGIAFKCGPFAVNSILNKDTRVMGRSALMERARSTVKGTNLLQVKQWAVASGLNYQVARRSPGAPVIFPAVMHWKLDHFAALLSERDGKYLVQDATFGGNEIRLSAAALDAETDGYFLVPHGELPTGWKKVADDEASSVWGRGGAGSRNEGKTDSCPKKDGDCPKGMARPNVFMMQASLNIRDVPLFYTPPVGQEMNFILNYNHLEGGQPGSFTFPNVGPNWSLNWISYLTVDASQNLSVRVTGGGVETYNYSLIDNITNTYAPNLTSQAVMVLASSGVYHRKLPDGSIQVFNQSDGSGRIFMTEAIDPQGNSSYINYDGNFRITTILDALNQATTFTYKSNSIGNVGYYKIDRITDPFGRYASFTYDSTSTNLVKITDMIGIESSFSYDTGTFISSLDTPYGKSRFYTYAGSGPYPMRGLALTYPDGSKEVVESWIGADLKTYYWNKRAIHHYPSDPANKIYSHCEVTAWLFEASGNVMSPVMRWNKKPLENPVNYYYAEQPPSQEVPDPEDNTTYTHYYVGISNRPTLVDRVLDDGTTHQTFTTSYNDFGRPVQMVDPLGRTITLAYAANNVDLLEVRQTRGGDNELLGKWTYNAQHRPLTYIDASGQKTIYTYNARGQLLTVTDAKNKTTTLTYDVDGYLTTIDGPLSGSNDSTTLAYDGFGRIESITDSEGYTVEYDYDALNRLTLVSYPDSTSPSTTYQQIVWDKLDPVFMRDRLGRWTSSQYNAVQQLTAQTDPLGRTVQYDWCSCGALDALIDAAGNRTEWGRDDMNRVTSKKFADDNEITYTYENTTSRLKTMTDALGQVKTYSYNVDNSLAGIAYTNSVHSTSNVSYTYDPDYPRPLTVANGWGTYTFNYNPVITDPLASPVTGGGQLHTITNNVLANSTIEYLYDELGRVVERSIDGSNNETVWTYDDMGRVSTVTNPLGSFDLSYQNPTYGVTRLASVEAPNGMATSYAWYNNAGDQRLQTITHETSGSSQISEFGYQYNAEGMITQWTQQAAGGTTGRYEFGYDAANQLTAAVLKNHSSGAVLKQYFYGYDTAGNRGSVQTDNAVSQLGHNNINQITSRPAGGPVLFQGSISEPGTVKVDGQDATMTSGTTFKASPVLADGSNLVDVEATDGSSNIATDTFEVTVSGAGGTAPTYDDNGNMTANGTGQTYQWDAEDRLIKITYSDSSSTEFTYDAMSRRVKILEKNSGGSTTGTKQHIWCGMQICEERNASNTVITRFYSQGEQVPGASSPADKLFYTRDHLGSVHELVDDNEVVRGQWEYDPYGQRSSNLITSGTLEANFAYTGHYTHATSGLTMAPFRAYDANLGRWLSRDPMGESDGPNIYSYVANDPINGVDPLGLDTYKLGISIDANAGLTYPQLSTGGSATASIALSFSGNFPYLDIGIVTDFQETSHYMGAGANISGNVGASDACDLLDLEGTSTAAFVDLGLAGPIGGAGLGFGNQRSGAPYVEVNGEVGLGGQSVGGYGIGKSETKVYSAQGLGNWIGGLFK